MRRVSLQPGPGPRLPVLCEAEGWPSLPSDAERARRPLTAPGATCGVAVGGDTAVGGFAQMMGNGEIQAFLANLLVTPALRQQGVGRALIRRLSGLRAVNGWTW